MQRFACARTQRRIIPSWHFWLRARVCAQTDRIRLSNAALCSTLLRARMLLMMLSVRASSTIPKGLKRHAFTFIDTTPAPRQTRAERPHICRRQMCAFSDLTIIAACTFPPDAHARISMQCFKGKCTRVYAIAAIARSPNTNTHARARAHELKWFLMTCKHAAGSRATGIQHARVHACTRLARSGARSCANLL